MSKRFVTHDTMVIERTYDAAAHRVFAAWTDAAAKTVWMLGSEDGFEAGEYTLDFRVGGTEWMHGEMGGNVWTYLARYDDIVDDERIVYSYYMMRDDVRISVSVTSVEFRAEGERTHLVLTEHGMYLDGEDKPELRFEGISGQLEGLARYLDATDAA